MKKILLLLLLCASASMFAQETQEKYQHAKINYSTQADLLRLSDIGIPIEHGFHKKGVSITSEFSVSEISKMRQAGYQVDVLIEDAKAYFLEQNRLGTSQEKNPTCDSGTIDYVTPTNFELGSMGGYLTYQELLNELDEMRAAYPNLITQPDNISTFLTEGTPDNSTTPSIGGNPIKWVKISDNPESTTEGEPQILYTALHHAREPAGLSQLIFYMWYLLENYDSDPEVQAILNNTELYFVPVINPDGYLYNEKTDPNGGGFWRKNRKDSHGTDLNRNYDYYINGDPNNGVWGGEGASSNTGDQTYHGPSPFSEVETQAIKWFVENHNFVMAFNNHTSGDLLLYPYGYTDNAPTPEDELFIGVSNELVSQNGFNNIISSDLYPAAGDSDDFMYGTVGTSSKVYAFTPEIGPSFWPPSSDIIPIAKGMMYLNLTAAKMVNEYAKITDNASSFVGNTAATATFDIKRLGLSGNGNFTVSLTPVSSNITSAGSAVTFNGLTTLETQNGSIAYTLANTISTGDVIEYDLVLDNGTYETSTRITKTYGALSPLFEDAGNSVTANFDNNGWGVTNSTFVSAPSSITESPSGNSQDNANETITISDPVDLTNADGANVSFYAKWDIESNFDYVQFEVSTNNGQSWQAQCGKFTNSGSTNSSQPTGEPLYDGTQNDWVFEEIDLSDYLGETILVRFQFRSDGNTTGDGFYFDDLTINTLEDPELGINDSVVSDFVLYPNPVTDLLTINTQLSNYEIKVYSLQGQLISESNNNKGSMVFDYSAYASGLYIMRLTSEGASETFKILKN